VIGLSEVTPYSITFKFFNLMFSAIFVLNNSVLPIMGREIGNKNWEWITRTYRRLIRIVASFGGLACVGGIAFGHDFILLWTGPKGYAGPLILLFLGLYSYLLSMVNLNSSLLNAFNYTKGLPFFALLEGLVKIGSSILFGRVIGLSGIALGTLLGSLLVPTIICPVLLTKRSGNRMVYPLKELCLHFLLCVVPCVGGAILSQTLPNLALRLALGALIVVIYSFGSLASWGGELRGFARETVAVVFDGIKRKGQRA
jgi:O-antigen/teichoic acid export membrane protein